MSYIEKDYTSRKRDIENEDNISKILINSCSTSLEDYKS